MRSLTRVGLALVLLGGCDAADEAPVSEAGGALPDAAHSDADASPPDALPPDAALPDALPPDALPPDAFIDPFGPGLRMNQVRARGTHNSYHLRPDNLLPDWQYDHLPLDQQLEAQHVRQFELDVHFKPDGFRVFHLPAVDARTTCDRFTDCLAVMRAWSDANRGHVPLVILVEPKDDVDPEKIKDHLPALEAEIRAALPPSRLLTPDDVRGDFADVRTAVTTRGWPVLDAVRGRMLFVLLDHGETRDAQLALHPDSAGGVFFVPGPEAHPASAFLLLDDAVGEEVQIRAAVEAGFMVRTRADDEAERAAALRSGAHTLSSDFPEEIPLEPAGGPGCNPVTAPPDCEPAAVEVL